MGFMAPLPPSSEEREQMAYVADPVKKEPTRKKVYAEVLAEIQFTAPSHDDAERLVTNFLARRGITQHGNVQYGKPGHKKTVAVRFSASYRVHGGWPSDFVKKIESDASDMGTEVSNLQVSVTRTEIPAECPRKECFPCNWAVNPELRRPIPPAPDTLDSPDKETTEETNDQPTRWRWLRR